MRGLASIETISTNALDIINEDGKFSSGWIGEIEAREETIAAKLKQQRIFVHELYAQPKASQALLDDATIRVENWLGERLRDSFVKMENNAFINGDGIKKPEVFYRLTTIKSRKLRWVIKLSPMGYLTL